VAAVNGESLIGAAQAALARGDLGAAFRCVGESYFNVLGS
jgi:hypothetical protein